MVTSITAEFETPESAEAALRKIRENVSGVYSTNFMYNRRSDDAERLRGATIYRILPTAVTAQNYMTATLESPASVDVIPEQARSRRAKVFIVCDGSRNDMIHAILTSSGASNIKL